MQMTAYSLPEILSTNAIICAIVRKYTKEFYVYEKIGTVLATLFLIAHIIGHFKGIKVEILQTHSKFYIITNLVLAILYFNTEIPNKKLQTKLQKLLKKG